MFFLHSGRFKKFTAALFLAIALTVTACSGDSECDSCDTDADCDSGQSCLATTLGDRCVKSGDSSCKVDITQL